MPRPQDLAPTYDQVIEKILREREAFAPMPVLELAQKISAERPSTSKDPIKAAEKKIKEAVGRQLVYLDSNTIVPLQIAWQGARFRMDLSREEVNKGFFDVGIALSFYLPNGFNLANLRLVDMDGLTIKFKVNTINKKVKGIFGTSEHTFYYCHISEWLRARKFAPKDHLLFTILDRENGVLKLEHEPHEQISAKLLESRNRLLADILYDLLENSSYERIFLNEALPTAYARLPEKDGYPPYHWVMLLANDERMETDGWDIVYRDGKKSMLDSLFDEISGTKRKAQKKSVSKESKEQVYRFKAQLKYRPKIWRVIEIQGKNTLSDFNRILVDVFDHDFDHLGGFWKLVPRGGTKRGVARYREVDLGSVDPFGGGDGAALIIAELELAVGNKMKYVFDFGDWIEHVLTLEAIEPPQPNAKYPREAKRNTPKYANCVECLKKGKETTAIYVCVTCTKNPEEERLLCEDCVKKHDSKDHYVEKILY
ncbi:MAG TPA: hypothetical protein VGA72_09395 [Anaerolineales bacterium]